jgi:hypothetical protein
MTIDEQVEAAWEEYKPEALSTNSMVLSHDVFAAGYLAMAKSLYVEVKPEDSQIQDSVECWARINNRWYWGVYWKAADEIDFRPSSGLKCGAHARTRFDSVLRVASLPTPSSIFGEEV